MYSLFSCPLFLFFYFFLLFFCSFSLYLSSLFLLDDYHMYSCSPCICIEICLTHAFSSNCGESWGNHNNRSKHRIPWTKSGWSTTQPRTPRDCWPKCCNPVIQICLKQFSCQFQVKGEIRIYGWLLLHDKSCWYHCELLHNFSALGWCILYFKWQQWCDSQSWNKQQNSGPIHKYPDSCTTEGQK